ncbi:type VI secretion system baseplate subunit TssF [Serratia marcescens]|uniref:Type VI secretion system baseplate subunit TssF n=1 Tax=Serratia marcescens TaxID=615 RepID=A0ABD5IAU6_SERMA|nr:type VI secretion system baseplate subunit TssF [Serratia marcescens]MDX7080958.1 type VI secretion system baseplate subunit TssF [Serratia marcescens]
MFSERFLQLYNDELRYFREAGRQFASSHPQVAQHLGMHIDGVLDPFVERLLEGSAFLCTRIQEKLNNEQPEFALQMLSRLAPLWYTPVPAIATVAIKPDLSFPQWHSQVDLPRGSRMTLNDISLNNKPATFTTARHIKVQPVEIALAECEILPPHHLPDGAARHMQDCSAYVRIGLTTHGVLHVSELDLEPLHLTLAEDTVRANQLMAALLNRTLRIVLWAKNDDRPVIKVLQPESLRLGGVGDEEALLPTAVGELPGNRLMREYFAAPSRFFSLELHGVRDFLRQCERVHEFEILFALEQRPLTLIGRVNARDFHLFATPVINLYRRHCSPVLLTGERTEHQLVVDRLNTSLYEIHSVKQVKGMLPDGNPVIFSSLQADVHYDCEREPAGYTLHRRREPSPSKYNNPHLPNEDTFIAISPGKSGIDIDDITSLSVEALVCERHLVPAHLQQPHFQLETAMPIHQVEIVRYPSNPVAVPNISQAWQAIQMLASNPLRHARPDVQDCSALLRDWLSLFCHQDDSSQRKRIASIKNAWVEHHFERNQGPGPLAWIRGAEIAVNLSANHHADHGAYLFGKILHHALSQYGDLNQTLSMKLLLDGETHADWGALYYG